MKLFISYSSKDHTRVDKLKSALSKLDHEVWFAPDQIGAGSFFAREIDKAMKNVEVLIVFASRYSVGVDGSEFSGSEEVMTEITKAREKGIPIIPLNSDGSLGVGCAEGFDYLLKKYQWIDIQSYLKSNAYEDIAENIGYQLSGGVAKADNFHFDRQIEFAENLLKERQFSAAFDFLNNLRLPVSYEPTVRLLKIIAFLQQKVVKNISKQQVDYFVEALDGIGGELKIPASFLKALLSESYYKKNGYADVTEGFTRLKLQARVIGKLKGKYLLMTSGIVPEQPLLAQMWREQSGSYTD
ncbi:toll/interleukin-1 receptor domain-containing protein [Vibrio sp. 1CM24A]|uniref:toll/interleukin-1 receptor domain-containing protein n=1 Tax=Vibrio sp. 1CM24A TaxID=2929165 RepID=UPI0020BF6745|nr:toll/interleukin-1 receptor domain-containing protein [Vibrio sp. 1CM24A]MCK8080664.1 toll/interleukin-1 receptor domain-containing protein [Vibrio sp. 1CM24A]